MICDDSAVIRSAIARILLKDPSIEIVARVGNGAEAIECLKTCRADVAILDIEMPVMDGLTALPLMLKAAPALNVIMASTLSTRGADVAMRALRLGAADYVPKPSAASITEDQTFGDELIAKVKGVTRLRRRVASRHKPDEGAKQLFALRPAPKLAPRLLAIGSSTGGPNALFSLIQGLRGCRLSIPIVLTQHMPGSFIPILAQHIDRLGVMPCSEAVDGASLLPDTITVASGDRHMLIERNSKGFCTRLADTPPENFCRPSVDPMLRSASVAADGRVLVLMLTGMGHDGLSGARQVVEAGGAVLAQDEATSVVWGMPGAVARAGLAHAVLPLAQLSSKIHGMTGARN